MPDHLDYRDALCSRYDPVIDAGQEPLYAPDASIYQAYVLRWFRSVNVG